MFSNERPGYGNRAYGNQAYGNQAYGNQGYGYTPKPPVAEDVLATEKIQVERKLFILTLRENPRGRFLRITEDVAGRHNSVIVPATGLEDFKKVVDEMVRLSNDTPPKAE